MMASDSLNDSKNWYNAAIGLKYLKEGLESYVDDEIINLHNNFLQTIRHNHDLPIKAVCNQCTLQTILSGKCPNNVCDKIAVKIVKQHRNAHKDPIKIDKKDTSPCWKNTDVTKWCSSPWEIAKCFMEYGYAEKMSAKETDCRGILSVLINCLSFQKTLTVEPPNDIFSKMKTTHDTIMSRSKKELTDVEFQQYVDEMINILKVGQIQFLPAADTARAKLKQILPAIPTATSNEKNTQHERPFPKTWPNENAKQIPVCVNCRSSQPQLVNNSLANPKEKRVYIPKPSGSKSPLPSRHSVSKSPLPGRHSVSKSPSPGRREPDPYSGYPSEKRVYIPKPSGSKSPLPSRHSVSKPPLPGRHSVSKSPLPGRHSVSKSPSPGRREPDPYNGYPSDKRVNRSRPLVSKPPSTGRRSVSKSPLAGRREPDPYSGYPLVYSMKANPRGTCLIISNELFQKSDKRVGTEFDVKGMTKLFKNVLHFNVVVKRNLPKKNLGEALQGVSSAVTTTDECFVCIICSHGDENGIACSDEKTMQIDEIAAFFDGNHCSALVKKPKLFFIQACQGGQKDRPVFATDSSFTLDQQLQDKTAPTKSDMLIACASHPGFVSIRNEKSGTWFLETVKDVFTDLSHRLSLTQLLTIVNRQVSQKKCVVKDDDEEVRQAPMFRSSLTKELYFFSENIK